MCVGAVRVAAFIKWGIEWVKVAQARERPVGKLIWAIVDIVTARTVDLSRAPLRGVLDSGSTSAAASASASAPSRAGLTR